MTQSCKTWQYEVVLEFVRHKEFSYSVIARNLYEAMSTGLWAYDHDTSIKVPRLKPINITVIKTATPQTKRVIVNYRWKFNGQVVRNRFRYRSRMPINKGKKDE